MKTVPMITRKVRYIILRIHTDNNKLVRMSEDSFMNIFKDKMFQNYGKNGLIRFYYAKIMLFLLYNQIIVLRVSRMVKNDACMAIQQSCEVSGRNIRFTAIMTKSSIKRVKKYLKQHFYKEEKTQIDALIDIKK